VSIHLSLEICPQYSMGATQSLQVLTTNQKSNKIVIIEKILHIWKFEMDQKIGYRWELCAHFTQPQHSGRMKNKIYVGFWKKCWIMQVCIQPELAYKAQAPLLWRAPAGLCPPPSNLGCPCRALYPLQLEGIRAVPPWAVKTGLWIYLSRTVPANMQPKSAAAHTITL
jgi:hypothetical protein